MKPASAPNKVCDCKKNELDSDDTDSSWLDDDDSSSQSSGSEDEDESSESSSSPYCPSSGLPETSDSEADVAYEENFDRIEDFKNIEATYKEMQKKDVQSLIKLSKVISFQDEQYGFLNTKQKRTVSKIKRREEELRKVAGFLNDFKSPSIEEIAKAISFRSQNYANPKGKLNRLAHVRKNTESFQQLKKHYDDTLAVADKWSCLLSDYINVAEAILRRKELLKEIIVVLLNKHNCRFSDQVTSVLFPRGVPTLEEYEKTRKKSKGSGDCHQQRRCEPSCSCGCHGTSLDSEHPSKLSKSQKNRLKKQKRKLKKSGVKKEEGRGNDKKDTKYDEKAQVPRCPTQVRNFCGQTDFVDLDDPLQFEDLDSSFPLVYIEEEDNEEPTATAPATKKRHSSYKEAVVAGTRKSVNPNPTPQSPTIENVMSRTPPQFYRERQVPLLPPLSQRPAQCCIS